jgi:hypothetical protein
MSRARDIADLSAVSARLDTVGGSSGALSNRNMIINGAMQIAQRATQSTNASSTGYKTLDRYYHEMKVNTDQFTYTTEQVSDAPSGFSKSFKITCTTAETALASDEYGRIYQAIEGNNLERIGFGTSDAKQTTLSFYVKSSLTGNFSASFYVNDANVIYSQAYTINAANTWERKTLTFPAYTTAGPNIDNTQGAIINFGLFAGSGSNTASTNWATYAQANLLGGQTASIAGTLNATWQITGIQLEVGDTATDFEHRKFSEELQACQRYYFQEDTNFGNVSGRLGVANSTTSVTFDHTLPVQMRANPSLSLTSANLRIGDTVSQGFTTTSGTVTISSYSGSACAVYNLNQFSGLTSYRTYLHEPDTTSTGIVVFNAEL